MVASPRLESPPTQAPYSPSAVLEVRGLTRHFVKGGTFPWQQATRVRAVDGVDITLERSSTLGLVGESGCGKTTTGRMIAGLDKPTGGRIIIGGVDIGRIPAKMRKAHRRKIQMVFQDPMASLDPRMTIGASISEPLVLYRDGSRRDRRERVAELLTMVGMDPSMSDRFPHQLSGGQRQRIGIARALALRPDIIVADEPTSALDVSVRAQVVNLMHDLQRQLGVSFIFISHDLSTVRFISDEVAVMYLGKLMERAPSEALFASPLHPYTKALLSAVPIPNPALESKREVLLLEGELPSPARPPAGCRFSTRCPLAVARCREEPPELRQVEAQRLVACHLV